MHHCLLCMGSNYQYAEKLANARLALVRIFPDIVFGKEKLTEAVGDLWLSPFCNQLARFTSLLSAEEIRGRLKEIEKANGRLAEDKLKGIVKLDIDLLMFDEQVLKPDDMQREYVVKGLKEWPIHY